MILLNGTPINVSIFPDGTSQVWHMEENTFGVYGNIAVVEWKFTHEAEFLHLAQLKSLLDSKNQLACLVIDYLPYARQDKKVSNDTTFALIPFAQLLNSLNFHTVSIMDPHSRVSLDYIDNSQPFYPIDIVNKVFNSVGADIVCYPDVGASIKYCNIYSFPHINAYKKRDQATGKILEYGIIKESEENIEDLIVLIVDDICDGGATFISLAEKLKKCKVKEVHLFVSHGLFTAGINKLRKSGIKRIFTAKGEACTRVGDDVVGFAPIV